MVRQLIGTAAILAFGLTFAYAAQRGKGGARPRGAEPRQGGQPHPGGGRPGGEGRSGNKPPGGAWSEGKSAGGPAGHHPGAEGHHPEGAPGAAGVKRNQPNATGKEGAAAGAAAVKRNQPNLTGKQGAAAGAAAANRNNPAATGAQGAAVGAAAANRNQPNYAGAAAGYAAVRNNFDHPNVYNAAWYAAHQGAWAPANTAAAVWTAASLSSVAAHCGYADSNPVNYSYGDNVTYQNGNVLIDGQNVGTGEEFSQQAADLAHVGHDAETAETDDWLPLGVFALVRNESQHPQLTLQLSVNQQGILRGNYTDAVSDSTQPIMGSVDKETQRAAWTIGDNQNVFMEAGLKNLTDGEAPTLMHKHSKTEKWLLVRLEQPPEGDAADDSSDSAK